MNLHSDPAGTQQQFMSRLITLKKKCCIALLLLTGLHCLTHTPYFLPSPPVPGYLAYFALTN